MSKKKKSITNNVNEGLALPVSPFDIVGIQEIDEDLASEFYVFLENEFGETETLGYVDGSIEITEDIEGLASEKLKELFDSYIEKTKSSSANSDDIFANAVIDKDDLVLLRIIRNSVNYVQGSLVTVDKKTALFLMSKESGSVAEIYVKGKK